MENQPNQPGEYDAVLGGQKRLPRDGDMVLGDTEKFIQQGRACSALKDYQGAINNYTQALQISPNRSNVYNKRGIAYFEIADYQGAIKDYTQAL